MSETPSEDEGRRTPIPVRELMPDGKPQPAREEAAGEAVLPESEIRFEVGGEAWVAETGGVTRSGTSPDSGASLLLVTFRRADDEGQPVREAWAPLRRLDEMSEREAAELFRRARPFRPVEAPDDDPEERSRFSGRRGPRTTRPRDP